MAKDSKPFEELKASGEQAAQKSMQQGRQVTEEYFGWLRKAMSINPFLSSDLGETLTSFTKQNMTTTEDYVRKLSQAKSLQDIIRVQTEYMQIQMMAFSEQAKIMGEAFTKLAAGGIKVPPTL